MSDKCYFETEDCGGAFWYCRTCDERFCENHGHFTDNGDNVECVACERERQEAEREAEPKSVSYDFTIDTMVCVTAPEGTDPDTLLEEAMEMLRHKLVEDDIAFVFVHTTEVD